MQYKEVHEFGHMECDTFTLGYNWDFKCHVMPWANN